MTVEVTPTTEEILALLPTTYLRDTDVKVRCPRVMINNPDRTIAGQENAPLKIILERVATITAPVIGATTQQITSCEMPYEPNRSKENFNGDTVFTLPAGILPGITEMSYTQLYAVMAVFADHGSKLQDATDIARETFRAAQAAQGINSPI